MVDSEVVGSNIMKIILYTMDCPKCKVLEMKLDKKHIKYDVCKDLEVMQQKGFVSAPMLEVDGVAYNFSESIKWVNSQGE